MKRKKAAVVTNTVGNPDNPSLTIDSLNAAIAAMRNAPSNDAIDAFAMSISAREMQRREQELYERQQYEERRRYHGRHPFEELERHISTSVEERRSQGHITYTTRFFGVPVSHRCDLGFLEYGPRPEERHQIVASEIARHVARELVPILVRQIERAEAEELRNAYGRRNMFSERSRHMWDEMRAFIEPRRASVENIPLETWLKHKSFELNGWKATLLETEEQITAEGENMQHCFARSYRNKIARKEYIGYHITAPEGKGLPKSGFTMGFNVDKSGKKRFKFDQVKGKKNDTHHCQNVELLKMIEHIDKAVNKGHVQMPDNIETRNIKIDFRPGAVNLDINGAVA